MSCTVTREGNDATLNIEVDASEVKKCFNGAVSSIASKAKIPGFRPGKAPRAVLETRFGKDYIRQEAFYRCVNRAFFEALTSEKLDPVSEPTVENEKEAFEAFEEGKDAKFTLKVVLRPEVELGDYKGLDKAKEVREVTEEDVDKEMENFRSKGAKMVDAGDDAIIEKGDFAIIDFKGTVDGEPFEGGQSKGYPLEVGSGSFIPGFEDQLIGLKKGEDTNVDVTFPETYFVKELAGKEAIFKVHVQDVKHKELPELTDEYVAKYSPFKTIAEAREAIKKNFTDMAESDATVKWHADLIDQAVENAKVDIPNVMVEDKITQKVQQIALTMESRKSNLQAYLEYAGMDLPALRESLRKEAERDVRMDLVLDAIADAEGLKVSTEDVEDEIRTLALQNNATSEDVKKIIRENHTAGLLQANIRRRKASRVIIDSAKQ